MNHSQDFARWITGSLASPNPDEAYPVLVAANRIDTCPLAEDLIVNDPAMVFVREEHLTKPRKGSRTVVGTYTGNLSEPGDVVELDDGTRFLIEAYRAAPFLAPSSPACLTVFDDADYRALIEDADAAFEDGAFEPALLNPAVLIADAAALAGDGAHAQSRFFVDEAGKLRAGMRGAVATSVAEVAAWGPEDMVAESVRPDIQREARSTRPWLGRYFHVLSIAALIPGAHAGIKVSGFAWSPLTDVTGGLTDTHLPVVALTDAGHVVWSPRTHRAYQVSGDVAAIVDYMSRSASGQEIPPLSTLLGVNPEACDSAVASLRQQFFAPSSQPATLAA
ncbi:MAG: hypothetical protein LBK59_10745 [Bifidobacteriaceae bacterium]|jgi:hypothetical protein|nr:hypothetical protein [Bifidobacteriaceae bacterium]